MVLRKNDLNTQNAGSNFNMQDINYSQKKILLDRFPLATENKLRRDLENEEFDVPLSVLTIESKNEPKDDHNYVYDRDIARGRYFKDIPWTLKHQDILYLSKYEGIAVVLISRFSLNQETFSAEEMSQHYFELCNYWFYVLRQKKINACFCHTMPHEPSSFSLYVCSKYLKIPYIFIDVPIIANKYRFLSCSFTERNLLIKSEKKVTSDQLLNDLNEYQNDLKTLDQDYLPLALRSKIGVSFSTKLTRLISESFLYFKNQTFSSFFRFLFIEKLPILSPIFYPFTYKKISSETFFKVKRERWLNDDNDFNPFSYKLFKMKTKFINKRKLINYKSKCLVKIPQVEYIYFASPAQPEATTLPAALHSRNVILSLKKLREVTPDEILILYKENPTMFNLRNPYISGVSWRRPDYYEEILDIKNVFLVDTDINTFELIDSSIGVASINGTAPIEAAIRGKTSITFGNNWYDDINGIYCDQKDDIAVAIEMMIQKKIPNIDFSKLNINSDLLVSFSKHIIYEFEEETVKTLSNKFISALNIFNNSNENKWQM